MLRALHIKDVGPAARFDLEFGERLNVLTGDNGLGKSFVLEVAWWALTRLGSFGPLADAWIFVGSMLATYGMARGYLEFWLVWVAVDAVGVPLLLRAGYYPSALLYVVYGAFCLWGFVAWLRLHRAAPRATDPALETVG